jgi:archaellum component FlaC
VSTLSDALAALKNIVLLQERLENVQRDIARVSGDVAAVNDYALSIDKRVIRIETMIEMTRSGSGSTPRIEG